MPIEIVMPRLSDTMESGTVARWLKHEGDQVNKGEQIADIETDKATMPLEAYSTGILAKILILEGQSAPIGTPIAVVASAGESIARSTDVSAPMTATAGPEAPTRPAAGPPPAAPPAEAEGVVRASP